MKNKGTNRDIGKNFFKEMNYEIAGELGILDNEEMKENKKLDSNKSNNKKDNKR